MTTCATNMDTYLSTVDSKKKLFKKADWNSVFVATSSIGLLLSERVTSFASTTPFTGDKAKDYVNQLDSGKISNGKLDTVQNTVVGISGQSYVIVRTVALILILICAIIALIKMAASNGQGKNEGKSGLMTAAFAIVALAALGSFVGLAFTLGGSLFG